jgi:hypothetical protein
MRLGSRPGGPGGQARASPGHERESAAKTYRISAGDERSTEALVLAGDYGYAHSCVTSDNFPVRPPGVVPRPPGPGPQRPPDAGAREIALLEFDRDLTSGEALEAARALGLERPVYEDALHFGIEHPDVQCAGPVVFLHEPWFGFFGRWDVLCLWSNAGRRELGLDDFDGVWRRGHRFAFVRPAGR